MLLNLTNHPSENWSPSQKESAIVQFGGVIDYTFPPVDPELTLEQVQQLARDVLGNIIHMQLPDLNVHVMGEFTFTYNLISMCGELNIPCFASTTIRTIVMNPDGSKTSVFDFHSFRPYF